MQGHRSHHWPKGEGCSTTETTRIRENTSRYIYIYICKTYYYNPNSIRDLRNNRQMGLYESKRLMNKKRNYWNSEQVAYKVGEKL